jgi:hypothetical protein
MNTFRKSCIKRLLIIVKSRAMSSGEKVMGG